VIAAVGPISSAGAILVYFTVTLLCVGTAAAAYKCIERPMILRLQAAMRRRR
jgi:hypothetical protein